ncbi:MAG: NifU family protein [Candidatus Kapaibacterium sp.]
MTSNDIIGKIEGVLKDLRPHLQKDAGDVEFVGYDEVNGICEVRLIGMCRDCPMSLMTLRGGIERFIIRAVPEVKRVENVR